MHLYFIIENLFFFWKKFQEIEKYLFIISIEEYIYLNINKFMNI
jgi:hypothetical protein